MHNYDLLLKDVQAEEFRQSHCDRKGQEHQCVGVATIERQGLSLDCRICGSRTETLENIQAIMDASKAVCSAAGVSFLSLPPEKRRLVMLELLAFRDY